ncbi:MAG: hypothetical protein ACLS5R_12175 [Blautia sp.]
MADLKKYDWQDYLKEEAEEARLEEYLRQMQNQLTSLSEEEEQEKEKTRGGVVLLDEEAVEKMYSYMELNYGRSYLNEFEQCGSIGFTGGACDYSHILRTGSLRNR